MKIRDITTEEQKAKLRKEKTVPVKVKFAVYGGANNPQVTMQFQSDVKIYNLWEALLYVESYEIEGYYTEGTAEKAIKEAIK